MPMKWNGKDAMAKVVSELERRMGRAVIALQGEVQRSLGVSAGKGGKKGASLPGQPPRYRTGLHKGSIQTAVATEGGKIRGTAGSYGVAYALILELGGTVQNPGGSYFMIISPKVRRAQRKRVKGQKRILGFSQAPKGPSKLVWISFKTARQRMANRLWVGGPTKAHSITIQPRPYLSRALDNNIEKVKRILFGKPIL